MKTPFRFGGRPGPGFGTAPPQTFRDAESPPQMVVEGFDKGTQSSAREGAACGNAMKHPSAGIIRIRFRV